MKRTVEEKEKTVVRPCNGTEKEKQRTVKGPRELTVESAVVPKEDTKGSGVRLKKKVEERVVRPDKEKGTTTTKSREGSGKSKRKEGEKNSEALKAASRPSKVRFANVVVDELEANAKKTCFESARKSTTVVGSPGTVPSGSSAGLTPETNCALTRDEVVAGGATRELSTVTMDSPVEKTALELGPELPATVTAVSLEVKDTPARGPCLEKEDPALELAETLFSLWAGENSADLNKDTKESVDETVVSTVPPPFNRLFTDAELDAIEECQSGTEAATLAGTDVLLESEGYEKELEDRMYPLDESETLARVALNAEAAKDPTLEDLSLWLGIPLDTLERTRQASPDDLGSPEHWQEWFQDTLETSEEAKRANRDFRAPVVNSVTPAKPKKTRVETVKSAGGVRPTGQERGNNKDGSVEDEDLVCANILLSLDISLEAEDTVRRSRVFSSRAPLRRDESKLARVVARRAVYQFLKDALAVACGNEGESLESRNVGVEDVPPLRDKMPELDEAMLDKYAERELNEMGTRGVPLAPLRRVVVGYYRENARRVWKKMSERRRRGAVRNAQLERKEKRVAPVGEDWTVPYRHEVEPIAETEFCLSMEDAAVNYVDVVEPSHRSVTAIPKLGLVEVVSVELPDGFVVRDDSDLDGEMPRVVKDGRRVVCSVGNFEALSSGYIECLPSRMLADTGATLSLVDSRVLKRLGRSGETLRPYEGTVKSSSGHPLRIRGWISLCLRLGREEIRINVLVADELHVDAILGVDALGAFGAVIDVTERSLRLKGTGEELSLGFTVVQDAYVATLDKSVRLPAKGQALMMAKVIGQPADKATVLIEGTVGLPPTLCVAHSLSTLDYGQVIVEVCNASTEECWVRRGTLIACATVIPESAFGLSLLDAGASPVGSVAKDGL